MQEEYLNQYRYKITNNKVIFFPQSVKGNRINNGSNFVSDNDLKRTYKGELTHLTVKLIKERITLFNEVCISYNQFFRQKEFDFKKKLVLLTLTLPAIQVHTDQDIKRNVLRPFLQQLFRRYGLNNWIWRAEPQSNGNIHFHLIIDKFIPKTTIQETWNYYLKPLGYIEAFRLKNGHTNPPTTQIELVKNQAKTVNYLAKYVCKKDNVRLISGSIWRCSDSLLKLKPFVNDCDSSFFDFVNRTVLDKKAKLYNIDFATILTFKDRLSPETLPTHHKQDFQAYYRKLAEDFYIWPRQNLTEDVTNWNHLVEDEISLNIQVLAHDFMKPLQTQIEFEYMKNLFDFR